jgi:ribonuclease Z
MSAKRILWVATVFFLVASTAWSAPPPMKVTLLGTGSPIPLIDRFGPSTLVEAGGEKLLFDCGRGVPIRLWQLHLSLSSVSAVFLTHLHSDHVSGLPDFWLTGWLPPPWGHRTAPLRIWGPTGTKDLMANLQRAFAWDIEKRQPDEHLGPEGVSVVVEEIAEGVVYQQHGVKVTAFEVDHGELLKPAFGYRVDYQGVSVVISGDTRPTENLIKFAAGTDVLIHEVAQAPADQLKRSDSARRIVGHHTTPEQAGRIFTRVKPRLAVYSHIALLTTEPQVSAPTIKDLVTATRTSYQGPLEVGEDLMSIDIGPTIKVHRFVTARPGAPKGSGVNSAK